MVFKLVLSCFLHLTSVYVSCSVPQVTRLSDGLTNTGFSKFDRAAKGNDHVSKPTLTIFYESQCPASVSFFKSQFTHNWPPFYDHLNITLVPYGKAVQRQDEGYWNIRCQHGEEECYYNRIQACAISKMLRNKFKKLFTFISCYMSEMEKEINGPKCALTVNIEFNELEKCAKSKEGDDLLAFYGNITHNFKPEIQWLPTIVLNNKFNQTENELAYKDLKSYLCGKLDHKPKICS